MKKFLFLIILFFVGCKKQSNLNGNFCEIQKYAEPLQQREFKISDLKKLDIDKIEIVDSTTFRKLFDEKMENSKKSHILGYFKINKEKFGIVTFNRLRECDSDVYFYGLQIFENCKPTKFFYINNDSDEAGTLFQRTSKFNKNFDTLTLKLQQTSEWCAGGECKTDTLFTSIYKFDLKSPKIDTIVVSKTYKLISKK